MKKLAVLGLCMTMIIAFYSFTIDCLGQFSIEASYMIDEHNADLTTCRGYRQYSKICELEANLKFYDALDDAERMYEWCIAK
jgi:hypothetical protein